MSTLQVNGQEIVPSKDMNLQDFLRDELYLTSVKNGCSEGAFGAKGIGEIVSIPTAPAVVGAFFHRDGQFRTALPLAGTPYSRKKG